MGTKVKVELASEEEVKVLNRLFEDNSKFDRNRAKAHWKGKHFMFINDKWWLIKDYFRKGD